MKKIVLSVFPVILLIFLSCASKNLSRPEWSPAVYTSYTKVITYDAPPEIVFPLFCPVREYDFMREWTCTMNYSKSGYAEKNAIFQSGYPWPFRLQATWVCTKYEPFKALTYTVFIPDTLVMILDHEIDKLPDGKTKDTVTYSVFGLNWLGKIMVKKMSKSEGLQKTTNAMSEEITYYLKNRRKIPDNN